MTISTSSGRSSGSFRNLITVECINLKVMATAFIEPLDSRLSSLCHCLKIERRKYALLNKLNQLSRFLSAMVLTKISLEIFLNPFKAWSVAR